MPDEISRIVLLNWLVSRSTTRARGHEAPVESGKRLFHLLDQRRLAGAAVEFVKMAKEPESEQDRLVAGEGLSFTRLADLQFYENGAFIYVALLLKHADASTKGFSVEDIKTFKGREIVGEVTERGVTAVHFMARLPKEESQLLDDGRYRCVLESAAPLTRAHTEAFLCRQLRRVSDAEEWTFPATTYKGRQARPVTTNYRYTPHFQLFGDVGRNLSSTGDAELSTMVFTKRAEKQSIGKEKEIHHTDVLANVQLKIAVNQGPLDAAEKRTWVAQIRDFYTSRGFETSLYYRHQNGGVIAGGVHQALDGAADILMCQRAYLSLEEPTKPWESKVDKAVVSGMREFLDQDELWERSK